MEQTREQLINELREIEGSYSDSITPEKQKRAQQIIRILQRCKCRNCGKEYAEGKSRAYYKGFCSAKCQHAKAKACGYRKGKVLTEFQCLKNRNEVGSVFVKV